MICPASTRSPSRTVISRIRPDVFAAMAESSPSMRPLTAMTPGGSAGAAKNARHTPKPARPAMSSAAATISLGWGRRAADGVCGDGEGADVGAEARALWPLVRGVDGWKTGCCTLRSIMAEPPFRLLRGHDRESCDRSCELRDRDREKAD